MNLFNLFGGVLVLAFAAGSIWFGAYPFLGKKKGLPDSKEKEDFVARAGRLAASWIIFLILGTWGAVLIIDGLGLFPYGGP